MIYFQGILMHGVHLKYNVFIVDKGAYLFKGLEVYSHSARNCPRMHLVQYTSSIYHHCGYSGKQSKVFGFEVHVDMTLSLKHNCTIRSIKCNTFSCTAISKLPILCA